MNFLIDAHLPRHLSGTLRAAGHTAIHTLDLPHKNRTDDRDIITFADDNHCAVLTKDSDFVDVFHLQQRPHKLWLLSTGNISNPDLKELIATNLTHIVELFKDHRFIELNRTGIIVHV